MASWRAAGFSGGTPRACTGSIDVKQSVTAENAMDTDVLRMLGTMLRFVRVVNRRFRESGCPDLTLSDLSVLAQIERGVDLPSVIADTLFLDRPRVSRISDQLVAQGYLVRSVDPEDRRRSRLSLTESGRDLLREGRHHVVSATDSVLGPLSTEERARLTESLASVRPLLEREGSA